MNPDETQRVTNLAWEDLELGAAFGPFPFEITRRHLDLAGEIYNEPVGTPPAVPPTLVPIMVLEGLRRAFNGIPAGGVLARQSFFFGHQPQINDVISIGVQVSDKYIKRGRTYVVISFSMHSPDRVLIASSDQTLIWPRRANAEGTP